MRCVPVGVTIGALLAAAATPVHAGGMGAVKHPVYVWPATPTAQTVGWAIANTTPARDVIVEVHLSRAEPNATFDVVVAGVTEQPYEIWRTKIEDGITTNGQGNGNAHVVAHIRQAVTTPLRLRVRITRDDTKYYVTRKLETIPIKEMRPHLDWLGGSAKGVCPETGEARSTVFCFRVRVRCADGREPQHTRVALWRDGEFHGCVGMRAANPDRPLAEGRVYVARRRLPAGSYAYQFQAANQYGRQWGPARVKTSGLEVARKRVLAVTSLTALATNTGVEATFSLSSAAQVQARILNIAGRTVKTLCHARNCEAGTSKLLWNGMSDQGLRVPNGTYLVEVSAKAEDGAQARRLARVRIQR